MNSNDLLPSFQSFFFFFFTSTSLEVTILCKSTVAKFPTQRVSQALLKQLLVSDKHFQLLLSSFHDPFGPWPPQALFAPLDCGLYSHHRKTIPGPATLVQGLISFLFHIIRALLFLPWRMLRRQSRSFEGWFRILKGFAAFPSGCKFSNSWKNMCFR